MYYYPWLSFIGTFSFFFALQFPIWSMVVIVTVAFIYFAYFSDSFAPVREERERPSVDRSGRFYEESEVRNDESYNIIDDVQTENENSTDS